MKNHRRFNSTSFLRNPLFGLNVIGNTAYFTAWDGGLYVADLAQNGMQQFRETRTGLSRRHLFNVVIADERLQPISKNWF